MFGWFKSEDEKMLDEINKSSEDAVKNSEIILEKRKSEWGALSCAEIIENFDEDVVTASVKCVQHIYDKLSYDECYQKFLGFDTETVIGMLHNQDQMITSEYQLDSVWDDNDDDDESRL